jgi:hypothetical protein
MKHMNGICSHIACDKAIYSDSAMLSAISVCILLHQYTGQPAYMMTKPVRERTLAGSFETSGFHPGAKLASTKHSIPLDTSGLNMIPLPEVPFKYQDRHKSALSFDNFRFDVNHAH